MLKINKMIFIGIVLLAAGCQQHQTASSDIPVISEQSLMHAAQITDLSSGQQLSPQALIQALSDKPMVILGEKHDNPEHHQIEQWVLEQLAAQRPQGSVVLEMITHEQQDAVNGIKSGLKDNPYLREQRLQELLSWNTGWPWPLYRGVMLTTLHAPYPLLAGNISADEVMAFYQNPQRPVGRLSEQPGVEQQLTQLIRTMHRGQITDKQLASMIAIQQQRDRFMAQQLLHAPKPTLLIAGAFHAASNLGVPLHIQDLDAHQRPVVVMLGEKGMHITKDEADYVWYVTTVTP